MGQETICEWFPTGVAAQRCHAGQETVCERFPVGVKHRGDKLDRKLSAKSFLLVWNTKVSCRTGNCL